MKACEFIAEFTYDQFPSDGPWVARDFHDPPFTRTQLKQMAKQGVIEMHPEYPDTYRLTWKAAGIRDAKRAADHTE
jgi:hypothetical protein